MSNKVDKTTVWKLTDDQLEKLKEVFQRDYNKVYSIQTMGLTDKGDIFFEVIRNGKLEVRKIPGPKPSISLKDQLDQLRKEGKIPPKKTEITRGGHVEGED